MDKVKKDADTEKANADQSWRQNDKDGINYFDGKRVTSLNTFISI